MHLRVAMKEFIQQIRTLDEGDLLHSGSFDPVYKRKAESKIDHQSTCRLDVERAGTLRIE
jgi:hypothetical protein